MNPVQAKHSMSAATANMHRIHKAIVKTSFEALNMYLRQGNLKQAEKFRQICGQNFYKMKSYEMEILKLQGGAK